MILYKPKYFCIDNIPSFFDSKLKSLRRKEGKACKITMTV